MSLINNFRLVQETKEMPPHLNQIEDIEGMEIYHSEFNTDIYVIFNEKIGTYRSIEYISSDINVIKKLKIYVKVYLSEI